MKNKCFFEDKPYWMMVYYGWITKGVESNPVYGILRNALMKMSEHNPYRGPKEYKEEDFTYANIWEGEIDKYSGEEKIVNNGKLTYKANYMGGLVDQKTGV